MADCSHPPAQPSDGSFISGHCPICLIRMALENNSAADPETEEWDSERDARGPLRQPASLTPGTIVGKYRLVGLIGRGGMGEVYRAEDLRVGQGVALKFLPAVIASNPEALERLSSEVRMGRQVAHPNVCRLFDLAEADGQHFIVMELVDGEDLASLLGRIGRIPGRRAMELARDLCAGLAACHDQQVIHGDLKPGNVMVDGRGRARIMDFGLSSLRGVRSAQEEIAGTVAYMAPEQLQGSGFSMRTDIYALGLILYEMFTGRRVHDVHTLEELREVFENETEPAAPSTVTRIKPQVEEMVMRCLDRRPTRRPRTAAEVATAFPERDPLEAAIAAGEIPSARTVAESADRDDLSLSGLWLLLGAAIAGLLVTIAGAERFTAVGRSQLRQSQEALAQHAREIASAVAYPSPAVDEAYGFTTRGLLRSRTDPPDSNVSFFFRQSARSLAPVESLRRIGPHDPPRDTPGMVSIGLNTSGQLRFLHALPDSVAPTTDLPAVTFETFFDRAALDPEQFHTVSSLWIPPVPYAVKQEWAGGPVGGETTVRAALYRNRAVYFDVADDAAGRLARVSPQQDSWTRVAQTIYLALLLLSFAAAAVLARRNIRRRWSDLRGARRIAGWVLLCRLLYWLFSTDYLAVADLNTQVIVHGIGQAFFDGAQVWLAYVALEPFVRRRWPRLTIGWNRLIEGRFSNVLVGRNLLVGSVFGILLALIEHLRQWSRLRVGLPPSQPLPLTLEMLSGGTEGVAAVFYAQSRAIIYALLGLFLFLFLRALLIRPVLAGVLWILAAALTWSRLEQSGILLSVAITLAVVQSVLALLVMVRFGLLASAVSLFVYLILVFTPLTFDLRTWAGVGTVAPLAAVTAIVLFGFRTALARRAPLGRRILEA